MTIKRFNGNVSWMSKIIPTTEQRMQVIDIAGARTAYIAYSVNRRTGNVRITSILHQRKGGKMERVIRPQSTGLWQELRSDLLSILQ